MEEQTIDMEKMGIVKEAIDLWKKARDRDYRFREIRLEVDSEKDENGMFTIIGRQTLRSKENAEDDWKEVALEVMFNDKDLNTALQNTYQFLQKYGMMFGDAIFEDGFMELVQGVDAKFLQENMVKLDEEVGYLN